MRLTQNEIEFKRNILKLKYNENDLRKHQKDKENRISKIIYNFNSQSREAIFIKNVREYL